MIERQISVSLGERSYPIYVGSNMIDALASICAQHDIPRGVVIITDANVGRLYLKGIEKLFTRQNYTVTSVIVPPGENQKSLRRAYIIYTEMLKAGVGRNSAVFALGGGVIGDLAGFVAATYQRGLKCVQMPTTLLSQVDSSVGGKVGVNHAFGKNMIGAFHQPTFVWVDVDVLATLPPREVVCGLGEIVKYAMIRDEDLFSNLEVSLDRLLQLEKEAVLYVQERCCRIKSELVSQDERELGIRVVLNYGHTIGHALEAAGNYRTLKHGEAVLLGMLAENYIAHEMGLIDGETHGRAAALIRRIPLRCKIDAMHPSRIFLAMSRDKKSVGGRKRFVLPTRVGEVRVVEDVNPQLIKSSLRYILGHKER